ncbi:MAG: putative ABC transporter permease subunit [Planctomycetota bacterium]
MSESLAENAFAAPAPPGPGAQAASRPLPVPPGAGDGLWLLLTARLRASFHTFMQTAHQSKFKFWTIVVLANGLWWSVYSMFHMACRYAARENVLNLLGPEMLDLFFFVLLGMLIFSNTVISLSSLFKNKETHFLLTLPISRDKVYLYKSFESLAFSSWAFMLLALPLLIAYGQVVHAPWSYYFWIFLFLPAFVTIPSSLGTLFALLLTAWVPRAKLYILAGLALAVVIGAGATMSDIWHPKQVGEGHADMMEKLRETLNRAQIARYPYLPSRWLSRGLNWSMQPDLKEDETDLIVSQRINISSMKPIDAGFGSPALFYFLLLSTCALFTVSLGQMAGHSLFSRAYSKAFLIGRSRYSSREGWLDRTCLAFSRRFGPIAIFTGKEIKNFVRDPVQWSQVLVFFSVLYAYVSYLPHLSNSLRLEKPAFQHLVLYLNLFACAMTMATLNSRFLFPLISLEGRCIWILGLLPIRRATLIWSKFLFAMIGSLVLSVGLITISNFVLHSSVETWLMQIMTIVSLNFGLCGLSVGLGATFPSFNETNPSKIVSGFGGTVTLLLSVGLVLSVIIPQVWVDWVFLSESADKTRVLAEVQRMYGWNTAGVMVWTLIINAVACLVPLKLGIRTFNQFEF